MQAGVGTEDVTVRAEAVELPGALSLCDAARGLVIFAHGSGSSRFSPRNQKVARRLVDAGCATLLFDLLTPDEAEDRRNVFDIELLGRRLVAAARWARAHPTTRELALGFFGASTGAAAALVAAAELGEEVAAIVSRGGRPDLAGASLRDVTAPTLLIVGALDVEVLELNRAAQRELRCANRLAVVEEATHLFEQPGALDDVAREAAAWFAEAFGATPADAQRVR